MKKIISLLIIFILILGLCGCKSSQKKFTSYSFDYFDTVTTIIGFEESEEIFNQNCEKIKSWLSNYHKLYDIYTVYENVNNLCKINMSNGKPVTVPPEIIQLLEYSKTLYNTTNQKLNIAMGSVLSIWHDCREYGLKNPKLATLPKLEELKKANQHTDISKVVLNKTNNTVCLTDKQIKLDVGGIAKGYAAQKVAEKMQNAGFSGYLLNIGGNVKIVGNRKDGQKWKIGIENPNTDDSKNPYIEQLELSNNLSLVTSGSYQRFYTVNGKNYHHIIDPQTLHPANYFKSVSVLCEDSGLADAFSTALFCMTLEEGKELVENTNDMYVLWVLENGEKVYSNGFEKFIK
ncbi:MAG: FAD:protein FMN transferase [Ruminococcaceae bacterium]|nr:FAD:protein FMN transferase [Oscillospiraceae bacterium]